MKKQDINQLKGLGKDLKAKVNTLNAIMGRQKGKLDHPNLKKVSEMGNELSGAMDAMMKGDTSKLETFIQKNANTNK